MSAIVTEIIILGIIFSWLLAYSIIQRKIKKQRKKLLETYDEKTNLSKLGQEHGKELRGTEINSNGGGSAVKEPSAGRSVRTKRREEVPIPTPSVAGKNSKGRGKPSSNSKGFLAKLRTRKQ